MREGSKDNKKERKKSELSKHKCVIRQEPHEQVGVRCSSKNTLLKTINTNVDQCCTNVDM